MDETNNQASLVFNKFFRKSVVEHTTIYVLDEEEADAMLEKMPPGSSILRIQESTPLKSKTP